MNFQPQSSQCPMCKSLNIQPPRVTVARIGGSNNPRHLLKRGRKSCSLLLQSGLLPCWANFEAHSCVLSDQLLRSFCPMPKWKVPLQIPIGLTSMAFFEHFLPSIHGLKAHYLHSEDHSLPRIRS